MTYNNNKRKCISLKNLYHSIVSCWDVGLFKSPPPPNQLFPAVIGGEVVEYGWIDAVCINIGFEKTLKKNLL